MHLARKLWQRGLDLLPTAGFHFDRPLVLLQSDDWGRAGLRDHEGLEQLRNSGVNLGDRPYDFYTLETEEDLFALREVLARHGDSMGRHPCLEMNFIVANLDLAKYPFDGQNLPFLPLADGLPPGWNRPNLVKGYLGGIAEGVFRPALHGTSHFCQMSVERAMVGNGERAIVLRTFWKAGATYIHWRMPWIGYEYWDPEQPEDERFLSSRIAKRSRLAKQLECSRRLFSDSAIVRLCPRLSRQ